MFNKHIQFVVLFVLLSSAGFLSFFLFFFYYTHGYAWFLPLLDLFAAGTSRLYPPTAALPVTVFHVSLWRASVLFSETTREPKDKLNECVFSLNESKKLEHFEIHLWTVCVGVGCSRTEAQLHSNVLERRQFYFSIENVHYGCLVQE